MTQAITNFAEASPGTAQWQVWLEGELLERIRQTVQEIATALAVAPVTDATTLADLGLFYGYLAQANRVEGAGDRGLDYLNAAINQISSEPPWPGFIGGYPQVGWAITQLAGKLFAASESDVCDTVDDALLEYLQALPDPVDYDLIGGLTGIGIYALARLPEARALECLRLVLLRLSERAQKNQHGITWFTVPQLLPEWQRQICPNGYYNLGLAHGVPGALVLLARACTVAEVREQAWPLLEAAASWLLANLPEEDGVPCFPAWIAPEVPPRRGRLAWCYDDLGSAAALLYAARCVGKTEWEALALRILRHAAGCRGEKACVMDAGICHGAAGNAHIFNRIYQATGEEVFKDAARHWYERVFDYRRNDAGIAGFAAYYPKEDGTPDWMARADFLNGTAGVGLALLAAISEVAPDWDECLLVSLSPTRRSVSESSKISS